MKTYSSAKFLTCCINKSEKVVKLVFIYGIRKQFSYFLPINSLDQPIFGPLLCFKAFMVGITKSIFLCTLRFKKLTWTLITERKEFIIVSLTKQIKDLFIQMNLSHYWLYNTLCLNKYVSQRWKSTLVRRVMAHKPSKRGSQGCRNILIHTKKTKNRNSSYQKLFYITITAGS